jgi:hypothetical protein
MALEHAADVRACTAVSRAALEIATDRPAHCQVELGGSFDETKGENGPSWSALLDHGFPLNPTGAGAKLQEAFRHSKF